MNQYATIILAGGKSSRMGKDKRTLLLEGNTFAEIIIQKSRQIGITSIYLSGSVPEVPGVTIVEDNILNQGPLGGLQACLSRAEEPFCLVLPVDVPQIPQCVLQNLLNFYREHMENTGEKPIPLLLEHGDRKEYLIGIYPSCMGSFIGEYLRGGDRSVRRMLNAWGCCYYNMEIDEWKVANINTPQDYENLKNQINKKEA